MSNYKEFTIQVIDDIVDKVGLPKDELLKVYNVYDSWSRRAMLSHEKQMKIIRAGTLGSLKKHFWNQFEESQNPLTGLA